MYIYIYICTYIWISIYLYLYGQISGLGGRAPPTGQRQMSRTAPGGEVRWMVDGKLDLQMDDLYMGTPMTQETTMYEWVLTIYGY